MEVESSRPPIIQLFYILYTIIVKLLRTLCTDEFIAISEVVLCFDVCEGAIGHNRNSINHFLSDCDICS